MSKFQCFTFLKRRIRKKMVNLNYQGFPNSCKGWGESEILLGRIFLPDKGNLSKIDFDNLNFYQS